MDSSQNDGGGSISSEWATEPSEGLVRKHRRLEVSEGGGTPRCLYTCNTQVYP